MKILLSTLLLLALLAACQPAPAQQLSLTEQDAGKTIEMKTGDTLVVALEGNLTTGYSWIPTLPEPALLEQVGEVEVTPASDHPSQNELGTQSTRLGAPGMIVLRFKAVAAGQTSLHLDYRRLWESNPPEKTFEVRVVVK
jgi:predicted secreted protein